MIRKVRFSWVTWVLLAVLTAAVAGITHVATVLALPYRSPQDAFARVSSLVAPGARAVLPQPRPDGDVLPFRDPAMLTAVCRYDLKTGPFRLSLSPFADGFVTIGFHGRHGTGFYGLTVQASDGSNLDLVLTQPSDGQPTPDRAGISREIAVPSPENEGFVTVSTPLGERSDRGAAAGRLGHAVCRWTAAAS